MFDSPDLRRHRKVGIGPSLAILLETQRDAIVEEWVRRMRELERTRSAREDALARYGRHVLAEVTRALHREIDSPFEWPELDFVHEGGVEEAILDLTALRDCVLASWSREGADTISVGDLSPFTAAFDRCIARTAARYQNSREHLLRALDGVSQAALESEHLQEFLRRLLKISVDTVPAVDAAAVFLERQGEFSIVAAVGLEEELAVGLVVTRGKGFVGAVAAEARPILIRAASTDPSIRSDIIREKGIRALYGVPLLHREAVLGVLEMGSTTAESFTEEEQLLFRAMASRAAAGIALAQLLVDERSAKDRAERAIRIRDDLLAVVSHDLRNPLGTIAAATNLLSHTLPTEGRGSRQVEVVRRSVSRMERLIADLLDMASIEAGALRIEKAWHDATSLIQEAATLNEPIATEQNVKLRQEVALVGVQVHCDAERILQVFSNLIGNALKFSRSGDTVTIRGDSSGDGVLFAVSDTGLGIHEEERAHIFARYWTARCGAKRGTGLGLYIARGIVNAHGGRIWVDSQLGAGSTFSFVVPNR